MKHIDKLNKHEATTRYQFDIAMQLEKTHKKCRRILVCPPLLYAIAYWYSSRLHFCRFTVKLAYRVCKSNRKHTRLGDSYLYFLNCFWIVQGLVMPLLTGSCWTTVAELTSAKYLFFFSFFLIRLKFKILITYTKNHYQNMKYFNIYCLLKAMKHV